MPPFLGDLGLRKSHPGIFRLTHRPLPLPLLPIPRTPPRLRPLRLPPPGDFSLLSPTPGLRRRPRSGRSRWIGPGRPRQGQIPAVVAVPRARTLRGLSAPPLGVSLSPFKASRSSTRPVRRRHRLLPPLGSQRRSASVPVPQQGTPLLAPRGRWRVPSPRTSTNDGRQLGAVNLVCLPKTWNAMQRRKNFFQLSSCYGNLRYSTMVHAGLHSMGRSC